jgi:5-methylcytosine-specific restriction enzyme B
VHLLIARSTTIGGRTKAEHVRAVLGFAGDGHDIPAELVKALESGLVNPGQGYNNYRWRQFSQLIRTVAALKRLSEPARRGALTEPAALVELLDGIEDNGAAIQRYSVEHLLFPDVFAPIVSREHRQRILHTWPDLAGPATEPQSFRLSAVVNALAPNETWGAEEFVNLYRSPYVWQ